MYIFNNDAKVPAIYISGLVDLLDEYPVPNKEIQTLLSDMKNHDSEYMVFHKYLRVIECFLSEHKDQGLGLILGNRYLYNLMGDLGYAMMNASSLRSAFEVFIKYMPLLATPFYGYIKEGESEWLFGLSEHDIDLGETREFFYNYHISSLTRNMKISIPKFNKEKMIKSIRFSYPKPSNVTQLKNYYSCPISFSHTNTEIVFKNLDLDRKLLAISNPAAQKRYINACDKQLKALEQKTPTLTAVHNIIQVSVNKKEKVSIDIVASALNMSTRTLRRKLDQEKQSFQRILETILTSKAKTLLKQKKTIDIISDELNYANISGFSTAFKRWTGQTPQEYRKSRS